jgi:hypothetical protein
LLRSIRHTLIAAQSIWIYAAELFPTTHRVLGIGFVASFARLGSIVSLFLAYVLAAASVSVALLVCCACCVLVCVMPVLAVGHHPVQAAGIALMMPKETCSARLEDRIE